MHRRIDSQTAQIVRNGSAGLTTLEIGVSQVEVQPAVADVAVDQKLKLVGRIHETLLRLRRVALDLVKRRVVTLRGLCEQRLFLQVAELDTCNFLLRLVSD